MAARRHTTPDLGLDTFLEDRLEKQSSLENYNGMIMFVRPETPALNKAVAEYFDGGLVNAFQFTQRMRRKKAEMFTVKKMAEGKNEK